VFGTPDVERLWDLVARATRLDEDDPVQAWETHLQLLAERARALNAARFDAVRFSGPGTDLLVGLTERSRWLTGGDVTGSGVAFIANLPTEEVFTTPDARRTEGTLRCTRPVALDGNVVEGVELTFAGGRLSAVRARTGENELREELAVDDGAGMLGEVALVDATSRVGQFATTFYDTLFDENATCHVALGKAYVEAVDGGTDLENEARLALGVNSSLIHLDVMLGGPEVDVDGLDGSGRVRPIIRGDAWVLERAAFERAT
jgi:aminopeptidase